jgi:citrate lyase subunit beta/citryl-CoA lyase
MNPMSILPPRSALYLPASNPRAIEKSRTLACDMVILDLEDAVKPGMKDEARTAAIDAARAGFGDRLCAIRINGPDSDCHAADLLAVCASDCDLVVLPKVEAPATAEDVAAQCGKPLLAMIETPRGVMRAAAIAETCGLAGLIAGTNDLANELRIPPGSGRAGLALALQGIVIAARGAGVWALDGVFNDLGDAAGLEAECREGRAFGFDGKTLIHPNQVDCANRIWSPSPEEIDDAKALIEAASGGAQRFRDRMIETMHVEMAKRLLMRAAPL